MAAAPLQPDAAVCFVCLEDVPPLMRGMCECRHTAVHAACLQCALDRVRSHTDGTCPVCRAEYACVRRRYVLAAPQCLASLAGTLAGVACFCGFAWLAVHSVLVDLFSHSAGYTLEEWVACLLLAAVCLAYACVCLYYLVPCDGGACVTPRCTVV